MHTLLALLRVKPASGYELARHSTIATDPVWAASHSQIYPLLRKLTEQGLVTSSTDTRGERLERTTYTITPQGEEAFQQWLERPLHYLPYRDPFRLWIGFMDQIPPDILHRGIDEHERRNLALAVRYEEVAGQLRRGEHPFIAIRRGRVPEAELTRIARARAFQYDEVAAVARLEVEAARRARALAHELHAEPTAPAPARRPRAGARIGPATRGTRSSRSGSDRS